MSPEYEKTFREPVVRPQIPWDSGRSGRRRGVHEKLGFHVSEVAMERPRERESARWNS